MSDERTQFTFYESFFCALSRIRKAQDRCRAYDAICAYALYGTEPEMETLPDAVAIAFDLIRPNLESSKRKAAAGKRGGSGKQTESKPEANDKQTESKPEAADKQTEATPKREREGERERERDRDREGEGERYKASAPQANGKQPEGTAEQRAPMEGKAFTAFWEAYPCKIGRSAAWDAWKARSPDAEAANRILAALEAWKRSERWREDGGRYIPRAAKWLAEGYDATPPVQGRKPAPPQRELDADETAAVRRMMEREETE